MKIASRVIFLVVLSAVIGASVGLLAMITGEMNMVYVVASGVVVACGAFQISLILTRKRK